MQIFRFDVDAWLVDGGRFQWVAGGASSTPSIMIIMRCLLVKLKEERTKNGKLKRGNTTSACRSHYSVISNNDRRGWGL